MNWIKQRVLLRRSKVLEARGFSDPNGEGVKFDMNGFLTDEFDLYGLNGMQADGFEDFYDYGYEDRGGFESFYERGLAGRVIASLQDT